jgi:purine-nucleoside phosphorylase
MDESLDQAIERARGSLSARGVSRPAALFLLGTGAGTLPGRLARGGRVPLSKIDGAPAIWGEVLLHWGELHGLGVWIVEDAAEAAREGDPAWASAFVVWLAAAAGASTLVHTSAGSGLDAEGAPSLGAIALVSDHLNLSGSTPLAGLRESRLGPLFPDQTTLHDAVLRRAALARCRALGLAASEAIAACSLGPSIETPAERRFFARAGAQVSAQRLATPLIAAAHAGLGALALVVVTHVGDGALDVGQIAAASRSLAPALDDLLFELADDVQRAARAALESE